MAKKAVRKKQAKKATKPKGAPKKASKRAKKGDVSFLLQKLVQLGPCEGGLQRALHQLREDGTIRVPANISRRFWAAVGGQGSLIMDYPTVRSMADRVRITIDPAAYVRRIQMDGNFRDYAVRLIGTRGIKRWSQLLRTAIQPQLLARARESREADIENAEHAIANLQRQLQTEQRELARLRKGKVTVAQLGALDPLGFLGQRDTELVAARSLVTAMTQTLS